MPLSFVRRVLRRQQGRIYEAFESAFSPHPGLSVLDVGVTTTLADREAHFFEFLYPHRNRITAVGIEEGEPFRSLYPEVRYIRVDRHRPLPFADGEFDLVFCSAVVEHVGSRNQQREFVADLLRVGHSLFLTTPNRWYPVELHTMLPLVHYLPHGVYRSVYRTLGFDFFSREQNLNLLDRRELGALIPAGVEATITDHRFLGMPSNLLLSIHRI